MWRNPLQDKMNMTLNYAYDDEEKNMVEEYHNWRKLMGKKSNPNMLTATATPEKATAFPAVDMVVTRAAWTSLVLSSSRKRFTIRKA